jgi:hypothetical protein
MWSETVNKIDFQQEQNKTLVVEAQHNLLKQENEKRWNSAENTWVDKTPLHPNDVHMIENTYKAELGNITNEQKASDFLKPFFVARDMGFLDAMLYKQPFTVTDNEWKSRSLTFKEPLPYMELQSFVQSMNLVQDWKTQFVDKVKEYVQGTLVVESLPTKKIGKVESINKNKERTGKKWETQKWNKLLTSKHWVEQVQNNKLAQWVNDSERVNGKKNSMDQINHIDSRKNWSTITVFNIDFQVNDSLKNYLKHVIKIDNALVFTSGMHFGRRRSKWLLKDGEYLLWAQEVMNHPQRDPDIQKEIKLYFDWLDLDLETKNNLGQLTQKMNSLHWNISTNKQYSPNQINQIKMNFDPCLEELSIHIRAELKKQVGKLPENTINMMENWLIFRWTEQVTNQFNVLQSQSSERLPKSKLLDMLTVSPFDIWAMQKHGISHDLDLTTILSEIEKNQNEMMYFDEREFYQLFADYNTIKKTENTNQKMTNKNPQSFDELITSIKSMNNVSNQKTWSTAFEWFMDTFESARSDSQTEVFMRSAMPVFEQAWAAIGQFGEGIQQLFDGLKKSGVWDEIAKIVDLLFGTWKLEDRLKRFNEIKEADLTLNQSWAMDEWFKLRKPNHEKHAKVPLETYAWTLKKELPDVLFTDDKWEKMLGGENKDSKEYQAFKQAFKEQTKWTSQSDPSLQDMIVLAHGTPIQKQNIHWGNPSSPDEVKSVVSGKVDTIYKRANDEKRDKTKNPNESFSRALLASLITPPKDSLRVARGVMKADKETNTTIESQKNAEINVFKNSLQIVQNNGKIKVETNPANENRKIHIDWKDVPYEKTTGIDLPAWKKFSIINTDPKHKATYWDENAIKVENIAVIDPQMKQEEGKIVLPWLVDAKNYTASVFDKDNKALLTDHALWSWQARELPIDKEKTPSYLILKDDDNGIKQKIAFTPKKGEPQVKQ